MKLILRLQGDPAKLSMKAAFGKVWKLEAQGGSIIGALVLCCCNMHKCMPRL